MEDKRKNLRKHIKAATDWLQQADKSIEQEDDLKGDLKLMLAKAELKSAEKHQNHSQITKILSFVTAAAIAFVVLFSEGNTKEDLNDKMNSQPTEITVSANEVPTQTSSLTSTQTEDNQDIYDEPIQTAQTTNAAPIIDEPDYIAPLNETNNYSEVARKNSSETSKYEEPEPVSTLEEQPTNVESTSTPREQEHIAPEARTPTEDMQKLMQSAGQILRAE